MDRRSTPRQPLAQHQQANVRLTSLSAEGTSPAGVAARVCEWSASGMRLTTGEAIAPGTPVRVDWPDQLALGEVCHCAELEPGCFTVGLRVKQVLSGLASLRALSARLMGEAREQPVADPVPRP